MTTREIARPLWTSYLEQLSKRYEGRKATLVAVGADIGVQTEAQDLSLVGLTTDGRDANVQGIAVFLGTEADVHITRWIEKPVRLQVKEDDAGEPEVIDVECEDGTMFLLRFDVQKPLLTAG